MKLEFEVPLRTESKANQRAHWAERARQAKAERLAARTRFPRRDMVPLVAVTLTRVGPRDLDDDNLAGALKNIRDGVADALRLDDASPLGAWRYRQERGAYAVRVLVEQS